VGVQNELKVTLLGAGGQTDGRTGPLSFDDNDGRLGDAGQSEPFDHQAETAA